MLRFFNIALLFNSQILYAEDFSIENKIKAGYLYNFTKFIAWPKDSSATFNLCLLGKDPFGPNIDPIAKKSAQNRPIKVIRLEKLNYGHQCHILFLSSVDLLLSNPTIYSGTVKTLTVSSYEKFAARGGMIGFVNRDDKIRLQVNLEAIKLSGLIVSAKVLEVAELVQGRKP